MPYFNIDGVNIYYELKGDLKAEETVVFFNGVMASTTSWNFQVPVFRKFGYKVLVQDFKGQLKSDKPKGPYSFKEHAYEAKELIRHLNIDKVHIVGTSYGGEVAMRFAIDYPELVKSISIIDSVSELDEVLKYFIESWKALAESKDAEKFFWGMMPSIYGNTFIKENIEMLKKRAEEFKDFPEDYFQGQIYLYDTFISDVYMTDELDQIKCPALVVCGEDDILKPVKFSKIIADRIPNSEFVVIPDCGHVTIFEKPDVLNSILLGFIMKNS
ncbi:MAG: alpha/beta hydrolase [Tissierellia bacterium]|nr:alpha/beta hydrolase [Tissierellia bacterium]